MKEGMLTFALTTAISGAGALTALVLTTILVEFWFGREHYFAAYLIGVAIGLLLAFGLFMRNNYIEGGRAGALVRYLGYMGVLIPAQSTVVYMATSWLGYEWYFAVLVAVLAATTVLNYLVYHRIVFRRSTPAL